MSGMILRKVPAALASGVLLLCLASCGRSETTGEPTDAESRIVTVTLAEAVSTEVREELFSVGRLVSRNTPTLASEINARVVEVHVDDGQAVAAGQVLLNLDPTTFELAIQEAEANIRRLIVSIENGQRRVDRYQDLKTKEVMPQERLDDAEAALAVDKASLSAAEARLAIARDRLEKTALISPVDGVVERRHVSVGDYAREGTALVTLSDTVNLRAEMPFPETVGSLLKIGQVMHLESPVAPGLRILTTVDEIRPQLSAMNQSLMVISNLVNPGSWRPQATVDGILVVETRPHAVVVPSLAVVKRPAGDVLYRLDSWQGQVARQVPVKTGVKREGRIEITDGLEPGDLVVVEGANYLTDGARVAVLENPQ